MNLGVSWVVLDLAELLDLCGQLAVQLNPCRMFSHPVASHTCQLEGCLV